MPRRRRLIEHIALAADRRPQVRIVLKALPLDPDIADQAEQLPILILVRPAQGAGYEVVNIKEAQGIVPAATALHSGRPAPSTGLVCPPDLPPHPGGRRRGVWAPAGSPTAPGSPRGGRRCPAGK